MKKAGFVVAGILAALVTLTPVASAGEAPHGGGATCSFTGGSADAGSAIPGNSLANAVVQAPIGGNQILNAGNCSRFLNDNLNGNLSNNKLSILGGLLS